MVKTSYETANSILASARELGFDEASFHQPPGGRANALLDRVFDTFTKEGRGGRNRHWIWTDLREPSCFLAQRHDLDVLLTLGAPTTPVWLVVEDFSNAKDGRPFWVFEGNLGAAVATIKNHHHLEFFVVSRRIDWLVGENHHDLLFGAGPHAVAMLKTLAGESAPPR